MALLDYFRKAAPVRSDSAVPLLPVTVASTYPRRVVSYDAVVSAEKAMANPIVFRMLNTIARAVQHVKFVAVKDPDAKGTERSGATELKKISDLLRYPNDSMNQSQLLYWLALNYASYGRVAFKVGTDISGFPNGIYPLETRWVHVAVDDRGMAIEYQYGSTADDRANRLPPRRRAEREGSTVRGWAHEIFAPDLSGGFGRTGYDRTITPLQAVGLPVQVTRLLMQRAVDTASGMPNIKYLIGTEKSLTRSQQEAIDAHAASSVAGGEESSNILFVHNTTLTVNGLSNDMTDIHSKVPMEDFTKMIAGAFGIPVPMLGLNSADAAKFAGNYVEARMSFWEDTLIPGYLEPIAQGLTSALCPPGIIVKADLDSIPAIADARIARAKDLSFVPFLTNDEKRELSDYPALTAEQRALLEEENTKTPVNTPPSTPGVVGGKND